MDDPFNETHWRTPSVGDALPVKRDPRQQKAKLDAAVNKPPGSL
jgi:hypothetical protein